MVGGRLTGKRAKFKLSVLRHFLKNKKGWKTATAWFQHFTQSFLFEIFRFIEMKPCGGLKICAILTSCNQGENLVLIIL
jgi:hypothetical protein